MKHSKRTFVTMLVTVLALCLVLTACKNNDGDSTNIPTIVGTSDDNTPTGVNSMPEGTPDGGDMTTPDTRNEIKIDYDKVYGTFITEWKSALNNYKNDNYTANDMLDFGFYDYDNPNSAKAYYALYDIDGNGIMELILKKEKSYEDIIAYIFTIKDGSPINIFGYDDNGKPIEVPWSRVGSSAILSNGWIDSTDAGYSICKIADDGYTLFEIARSEPYNYPDEAHLADAEWRYYINGTQVDYDFYVQYLNEQGYTVNVNNTLAIIDWINVD